MHRYLGNQVKEDAEKKMVFIGGPRQVGKTTFVTGLYPKASTLYLNWDIDAQRTQILKKEFSPKETLIFDELHKFKRWRNYLKGLFDAMKTSETEYKKVLVTGSARLDYYRFGGDSLQGRYHYLRLLPLSYKEIGGKTQRDLENLFKLSGFPEPFFSQSEKETRRWTNEYTRRLFKEDLYSLENIKDADALELLVNRLPETVGSPLSANSLREDLNIAHITATRWLSILERLYLTFRIYPFGDSMIKAVKKTPKLYFYNWAAIDSESARFENMIACHLLKYANWLEDAEGRLTELRYFRLRDGAEVDFVLLEKNTPILFVECKLNDDQLNPKLKYLKSKYPKAKAYQIHLRGSKDYQTPEGIRVCNASLLLNDLI